MRTPTYVVGVLAVLAVLTGCGGGGPKTTLKQSAFQLPNGWTKIENTEQGIAIAAPPGWGIGTKHTPDPPSSMGMDGQDSGGTSQMLAQANKEYEDQAAADVKAAEKDHVYISCIAREIRSVPGEERTRMNVEKDSVGGNAQMDDVIKKINDDLRNEEPPTTVDLPIGKAARIHAHVKLSDGGEVDRVYFGLVNGSDMYVVRFITEEQSLDLKSIADQAIQTLRITK